MKATATVPGVKAKHAVVTPACRRNRGELEAFDEAARRLREEYAAVLEGWKRSGQAERLNFHLVLTVEGQ